MITAVTDYKRVACPSCGRYYYAPFRPDPEDPYTRNTCPACDESAYASYMELVPAFGPLPDIDTDEIEMVDFAVSR